MNAEDWLEAEKNFVRTFVVADRRDRALFELSSERKRRTFFSKLNRALEIFDSKRVSFIGGDSTIEEICKLLRHEKISERCLVISYLAQFDRTIHSPCGAIEIVTSCQMECIGILSTSVALVKFEDGFQPTCLAILRA